MHLIFYRRNTSIMNVVLTSITLLYASFLVAQTIVSDEQILFSDNEIPFAAGRFDLSMFSRANCINNESITWTYDISNSNQWYLWTQSSQINFQTGEYIEIYAGPEETWRSAAINWGGGITGGWLVHGIHGVSKISLTGDDCFMLQDACGGFPGSNMICSGDPMIDYCRETVADNCNLGEW